VGGWGGGFGRKTHINHEKENKKKMKKKKVWAFHRGGRTDTHGGAETKDFFCVGLGGGGGVVGTGGVFSIKNPSARSVVTHK